VREIYRANGYGKAMLRDGPIPRFVHGILEYLFGVLFIAAPFLFDFSTGAATGMSVAVGVLILILAAVSEGPSSLVNQLPVLLHVVMLYLLSIFLIAAPFLLDFSTEVPPRNFFMISGVLLLLITIGTRFRRSDPESAGKDRAGSARSGDRLPPAGQDPSLPLTGSMPPAPGSMPSASGPMPSASGPMPPASGPPPPATGPPPATSGPPPMPAPPRGPASPPPPIPYGPA